MTKDRYVLETGESPIVKVTVKGDARIQGWDEPKLQAETEEGEDILSVEESEGEVTLECRGDLRLMVPSSSQLEVAEARGDLAVEAVMGPVTIGAVAGDLSLRGTGSCSVISVAGDAAARGVDGDIELGSVAADFSVRDVHGSVSAKGVGSDLYIKGVSGGIAAVVGADVSITLDPEADESYSIQAGSDIHCRLADDASARIEVHAGSDSVTIDKERFDVESLGGGRYVVTAGEGGPTVSLHAGDSVAVVGLSSDGEDFVDFGEHFAEEFSHMADGIARQVEVSTTSAMSRVSEHLASLSETLPEVLEASGIAGVEAERIAEKVRASSEKVAQRAAERAQKRAERAARRAERRAAKAERMAERRRERSLGKERFVIKRTRRGPGPESEPVSDEERLAVLRMLQEGKITAEEAATLLKAIGG